MIAGASGCEVPHRRRALRARGEADPGAPGCVDGSWTADGASAHVAGLLPASRCLPDVSRRSREELLQFLNLFRGELLPKFPQDLDELLQPDQFDDTLWSSQLVDDFLRSHHVEQGTQVDARFRSQGLCHLFGLLQYVGV